MNRTLLTLSFCSVFALLTSCEKKADGPTPSKSDTHTHADGTVHTDHDAHPHDDHAHDHDHSHDEVSLGTFTIDGMDIEAAQGHGFVEPGKLCHLVIKLPYNDKGQSVVRAWIGTEDRNKFLVGKGVYAPSHDDYDIHVEAPSPLPGQSKWWIEITKPDGTTSLGAIPILEDQAIPE